MVHSANAMLTSNFLYFVDGINCSYGQYCPVKAYKPCRLLWADLVITGGGLCLFSAITGCFLSF